MFSYRKTKECFLKAEFVGRDTSPRWGCPFAEPRLKKAQKNAWCHSGSEREVAMSVCSPLPSLNICSGAFFRVRQSLGHGMNKTGPLLLVGCMAGGGTEVTEMKTQAEGTKAPRSGLCKTQLSRKRSEITQPHSGSFTGGPEGGRGESFSKQCPQTASDPWSSL